MSATSLDLFTSNIRAHTAFIFLKTSVAWNIIYKTIAGFGIPEKWDPRPGTRDPLVGRGTQDPISETRDPGPQYDQVGPGTRDPLSGTLDSRHQNFQVGPGTQDTWSRTLMNNLLAWKFECWINFVIVDLFQLKHYIRF